MIDYAALLYGPIYSALGVSADLDLGTDGTVTLTVIDKTAGVEVEGPGSQFVNIQVGSIRPACDVRMSELTEQEVALTDLKDTNITFNGNTWRIKTHQMRPGPNGEATGEVRLILLDESAT